MIDPTTNGKHPADSNGPFIPSQEGNHAAAAPPADADTSGNSGRDRRGRFGKGNPDRPPRHRNTAPSVPGCVGPVTVDGPSPETPAPSGRDARGRFAKGNAGGPGNPFGRRLAALRRALLNVVSAEDIRTIARQILQQAHSGDLLAVKLLFLCKASPRSYNPRHLPIVK